jgi:hypothetical protein
MKAFFKAVLAVASALSLSACVSMKTYVDPQYRHASYDSIQRLAQPIPVKVTAQFLANGVPKPEIDQGLLSLAEQALGRSGVFTPGADPSVSSTITITANNIADTAAARSKGFHTGLTLGATGLMVDDDYDFNFTYQSVAAGKYEATYKHAIHSSAGNISVPASSAPTTPADAFAQVVRDVTLNFVKDLQEKGLLAK